MMSKREIRAIPRGVAIFNGPSWDFGTRFALALSAGAFIGGMLLSGGAYDGQTPGDVAFVGIERSFGSFQSILIVNGTSLLIILVGVLSAGLISSMFAMLLFLFLGIETSLIVNTLGLERMLVVTGPHAIFELAAFVIALRAALLPLGELSQGIETGEQMNIGVVKEFGRLALLSIVLLLVGATVEALGVSSNF